MKDECLKKLREKEFSGFSLFSMRNRFLSTTIIFCVKNLLTQVSQIERWFSISYQWMRESKFSTFIDECLLKLRKKKFFRFSHYSLSDRVCWMRVIFMCRKIVYIQNTNWPFILDRLPWNETIEIWHTHRWKLAKVREKKNPKFFDSSLCNRFLNTTIIWV